MVLLCLADPGLFRPLHSAIASVGGARLEVVELAAHVAAAADGVQANLDALSLDQGPAAERLLNAGGEVECDCLVLPPGAL